MKILYVEDNKVNAIVMDRMLSKENSSVIIAQNGKEALEIVKKEKPDLILLDINLGKNQMNGCELLKKIKELQIVNSTPVFAVTAYAMPKDEQYFMSIGFDKYFSKPIDFNELVSEIKRLNINHM